MQDELFADGVGEITVTGHIVRIDLVSLSPVERDASNNPTTRFRQRIVMPVDAFANAVDLMQRVVNGLVEADVVTRRGSEPASAPAVPLHAAPSQAASSQVSSSQAASGAQAPERGSLAPQVDNASPNFN